jgi:hypothetical protein
MSAQSRQQKIESYGAAHAILTAALERFSKEMWQYRPAPDRWTIHEIIIHITDSEANSYVRCRRLLAEPGSSVMGYDEWQWALGLDYHAHSTADAIELFKWLRRLSYTLIKDQPDSVWANTVEHTESGLMTLDQWLDIYERHIPDHVTQMQAVYDDWARQGSITA